MDEPIEAVARAIQIAAVNGDREAADRSWYENSERYRHEWRVKARAAIAAIQDHAAIVPKVATEKMKRAAKDVFGKDGLHPEGMSSGEKHASRFAAMLSASPYAPEKEPSL